MSDAGGEVVGAGAGAVARAPVGARRSDGVLRWALTLLMVAIGITHFTTPAGFLAIVPRALPHPLALVYVSGFFEIAGGLGLILPATRRLAAFGLVALYVAVFPANVNMAVNHIAMNGKELPTVLLWARLPLQVLLILWALRVRGTGSTHPTR